MTLKHLAFLFLKMFKMRSFLIPDTVPAFQDDDFILEAFTIKPQEQ